MKQPKPKQESLFTNDHDLAASQRADEIRACRLRCATLPGVALLSTLLFCFLTPLWFDLWEAEPIPIVMIVLGVCLSLVAIPCHLLGSSRSVIGAKWIRSILFSVGILLNTVGTSLSMTAYYIHIQTRPSTGILLSVAAICGGVYGLLTLLCEIFNVIAFAHKAAFEYKKKFQLIMIVHFRHLISFGFNYIGQSKNFKFWRVGNNVFYLHRTPPN
jgi:hypothetical protein